VLSNLTLRLGECALEGSSSHSAESSGIVERCRRCFTQPCGPEPKRRSTSVKTGERDRMHFLAYTLTRWFALLLLAIYGLIAINFQTALRQTGSIFLCLLTCRSGVCHKL